MDRTMLKKLMLCLGLLGIAAQASDSQKSALVDAIESNDVKTVESVLGSASESEFTELLAHADITDKSAFMVAAESGKKEVFDYLIEQAQKAGIDHVRYMTQNGSFDAIFRLAAIGGNVEIMEYLFSLVPEQDRSEVLNSMDVLYACPLAHAASRGRVEAVEWLLDHGADINTQGKVGPNVLGFALASGNVEVLDCLLKHIKDPTERQKFLTCVDGEGNTPLMQAAQGSELRQEKHTAVFMWLAQETKNEGIDFSEYLTAQNERGDNIFFWAVVGRNPEIVQFLFDSFAKDKEKSKEMINSKNEYGESALTMSKYSGSKEVERMLENFVGENS